MLSSWNTQIWGANSCNHRFCVCKHPVVVNISPTRHTRPTNPLHSERQECSLNSHATKFSTMYSLNFTNEGQDPLIHCNLSNKKARGSTPRRQISHKRREKPPLSLNSQATIFCTKALPKINKQGPDPLTIAIWATRNLAQTPGNNFSPQTP